MELLRKVQFLAGIATVLRNIPYNTRSYECRATDLNSKVLTEADYAAFLAFFGLVSALGVFASASKETDDSIKALISALKLAESPN